MALHVPNFMQPASGDASIVYSGQEMRQFNIGILIAATGVTSVQGLGTASGFKVAQHSTPNLTLDVSSGRAWVSGDDVTNQGTYMVWNDATFTTGNLTVPASGTYHHRVVLQIQDKLENGTWTGYQAAITVIADTGGGLPAEPNSAITLATVDVPSGSATITNSMINDYRQLTGDVLVNKGSDTSRSSSTSVTDDPDLQFLNLQASAEYEFTMQLFFNGANQQGGSPTGNLVSTWRVSSGTTLWYQRTTLNASGVQADNTKWTAADSTNYGTTGTSNDQGAIMKGRISTGAAPAYVVFQWGQMNSSSTATTIRQRSYGTARRLT